jgi:hypothetical protein
MANNTEILQQHINNMWLDYLNLTPDAVHLQVEGLYIIEADLIRN